jgi:iron complex transport system ATP-binding protein
VTVLTAHDVSVTSDRMVVLERCACTVASGTVLGICGPNGAGKSTLLRVLAGLQTATAGRVSYAAQDLRDLSLRQRAIRIGYLPQIPEVAWPITVRELAALGRFAHGAESAAHAARMVEEALAEVGLGELGNRPLDNLSGGERTRALLARLLAGRHPAMLADEPITALDPSNQLDVLNLFRARAQAGSAIALVLHDLALAARFCDRLLILQAGRVVAHGLPEILTPALLAEVFNVRGVWDPASGTLLGFGRLA